MTYGLNIPAIITKDRDGKILYAMPLKAVPAPGCWLWNTALEMRETKEKAA